MDLPFEFWFFIILVMGGTGLAALLGAIGGWSDKWELRRKRKAPDDTAAFHSSTDSDVQTPSGPEHSPARASVIEPTNADFVSVDVVMDESGDAPVQFVILEFETAKGSLFLRIPSEGADELASNLAALPFEHRRHRHDRETC